MPQKVTSGQTLASCGGLSSWFSPLAVVTVWILSVEQKRVVVRNGLGRETLQQVKFVTTAHHTQNNLPAPQLTDFCFLLQRKRRSKESTLLLFINSTGDELTLLRTRCCHFARHGKIRFPFVDSSVQNGSH